MREVKILFFLMFQNPLSGSVQALSKYFVDSLLSKLQLPCRQYEINMVKNDSNQVYLIKFDIHVLSEHKDSSEFKVLKEKAANIIKSQFNLFPKNANTYWGTFNVSCAKKATAKTIVLSKKPFNTQCTYSPTTNVDNLITSFEPSSDRSRLSNDSASADFVTYALNSRAPSPLTSGNIAMFSSSNKEDQLKAILVRYQAESEVGLPTPDIALRRAALKNNGADLRALVKEHGVDVNSRAKSNGFTALHRACIEGKIAAIKTLIELGADKTSTDNSGKMPEEVAKPNMREEIINALNFSPTLNY